MDPSNRSRRRLGSVWETRMQSHDEDASSNHNNAIVKVNSSIKEVALGVNGKRRTWKSDVKSPSPEIDRRGNHMKVTRSRSIGATPPVTPRRSISFSESTDKSLSVSVGTKKTRSDWVDGIVSTPGRVKKTRSELCTAIVKVGEHDSVSLRKVNSLPAPNISETEKTEHVSELREEDSVNDKAQIPEEVKGVCQETNDDEEIENGDHEEEEEEEREVEKKSVDVKEMNVAKENSSNKVEIKKFSQFHNRTTPSPSSVRKIPPPVIKTATSVYSLPPKSTSTTGLWSEPHSSVFLLSFDEASVLNECLQIGLKMKKNTTILTHRANYKV